MSTHRMSESVLLKNLVVILLLFLALLAPFVGSVTLDPASIFDTQTLSHQIFWELRLPRVLIAFFAGAVLALSGLLFQSLFRNALMTPYTLGISSGATLGVGVGILIGMNTALFGFFGALSSIGLLLLLSRRLRSGESLLLMGIALSFFYSAALMAVYLSSSAMQAHTLIRYTMGSLAIVGMENVTPTALAALLLLMLMVAQRHALQLLAIGEDAATLKGVPVGRTLLGLLLGASLAIGILISVTGPIGFVGLVVPHVVRRLYRQSIPNLLLPTALLGGLFLIGADLAARLLGGASGEIPIGIVTALLGAPFFVLLVLRRG